VTDLVIQLPLNSRGKFYDLFSELDERKRELEFSEYGLRISTLEEVFLHTADE
jgi:hypothetical protein